MIHSVIPATPSQQQQPLGDTFYTIEEAAQITGLRPMTLWGYLSSKKIMRSKIGGTTRIRASELRKLIVDNPEPSARSENLKKARKAQAEEREARKRKKAKRVRR
jgi:hypothetical protein